MRGKLFSLLVLLAVSQALADFTPQDKAEASGKCPEGYLFAEGFGKTHTEAMNDARIKIGNKVSASVETMTGIIRSQYEKDGIPFDSNSYLENNEIASKLANAYAVKEIGSPEPESDELYEFKGYMCNSDAAAPYLNSLREQAGRFKNTVLALGGKFGKKEAWDDVVSIYKTLKDLEGVLKNLGQIDQALQKEYEADYAKAEKEYKAFAEQKDEKPSVAVGAIAVKYDDESNVLGGLSTQLTKAIVKSGKYTAVDRSEEILRQLGKEQGYQRGGTVDNKQIKELGVQFGVQYMCVVQSSRVMNGYMLDARFVDVETAEIVNMGSEPSNLSDISELMRAAEEISHQLLGRPRVAKPIKKSFWVGGAFDLIGAGLLAFGVVKYFEGEKRYKNYSGMSGSPAEFEKAWKNVERSRNAANILFWSGGAVLGLGIGVHLVF